MIQRKSPATTVLVGCQGHPVFDSMHSVVPLLCMSTIRALQEHAPTLEETLRIAGSREGYLLSIGSSDEQVSLDQVREKWLLSRMQLECMQLECLGFLPIGGSRG